MNHKHIFAVSLSKAMMKQPWHRKATFTITYIFTRWFLWGGNTSVTRVLDQIPKHFLWTCPRVHCTNNKSTLMQIKTWCRQAINHYLSQRWPWSMSSYGITRPKWYFIFNDLNIHFKTIINTLIACKRIHRFYQISTWSIKRTSVWSYLVTVQSIEGGGSCNRAWYNYQSN